MSDRKRRRERFFLDNPFCCFCGGATAATTEDHQPGRVFFQDRHWPESFVFPACEACNAASRMSENVMAVLIHGEAASTDRTKFQSLIDSINREFPDLLSSMLPNSANEIRSIMRKKSLQKPAGLAFSDMPIVKLDPAFWGPHFQLFTRKLLLAFHYACFKKPLSHSGVMWGYHFSNVDAAAGKLPQRLIELAPNVVLPTRSNRQLQDQFSVRWDVVPDRTTGLFFAQFHDRFAISGVTTEVPEAFTPDRKPEPMRPFFWGDDPAPK